MGRLGRLVAGSALLLPLGSGALAADLPLPPPEPEPVVVETFASGWYLRGDIGAGFGGTSGTAATNPLVNPTTGSLGSNAVVGVGVGIKTKWLRTDVTVDYLSPVTYRGTITSPNDVSGRIQATAALFNGYIDLGTWYGLTPYIGAGVGVAFTTLGDFSRSAVPISAGSSSTSQTNLAYAAMAGVAFAATPNLQVDVGYRYLNIGDVNGPNDASGQMTVRNVASHEIRAGVRWGFNGLPIW
jgi:opacity protein-like surface antigen